MYNTYICTHVYIHSTIRENDRLLMIDGESVHHASFEAVARAFSGPVGSKVTSC